MKRLSLIIAVLALFAYSTMAQQAQPPRQSWFQSIKKAGGEKNIFHLNIQRPTTTDTIGNLQPCDSLFYLWFFTVPGDWLSGHNEFIDSAKAERYQGAPGDHITGLWVFFGDATYTNSTTQKCHLKVWAADGPGGTPGTVVGNVDRTHKSIADDIAAGNLTTVYFSSPLTMPAGGNFYAGVQLDYKLKQGVPTWDTTRAVTLVNSDFIDFNTGQLTECGDTTNNTAWEKYSDGSWHSYAQSYGFGTRNPVFAITTTTGCSITVNPSAPAICKGKQVTLTASGATTYTWAPATGLNVTTGTTVKAKPNATTTYTVTGDGGNCSTTVSVTVNPPPSITISQAACASHKVKLTAGGSPTTGVTYQWYKNNVAISGATAKTYNATATASYTCLKTITATGCTKLSAAVSVTVSCKTTDEASDIKGFDATAYPNPFSNSVSITISSGSTDVSTVTLLDFSGRTIREYNNVDTSVPFEINENLSAGIYFVRVVQGSNQKMLKVVKND